MFEIHFKSIIFQDKLLEHEKVHSEYSFPCNKCSKTFHTNDALKHHLPLHEVGTSQMLLWFTMEINLFS